MLSLVFSSYSIMSSANSDSFASSFSIWFLLFLFLVWFLWVRLAMLCCCCFLLFYLFLAALGLHCFLCRLSLVEVSRGCPSLRYVSLSLHWLLLLVSTGSKFAGFSSLRNTGSVVVAHGLIPPRYVGSSKTRDRNCVLWIDRWILNH